MLKVKKILATILVLLVSIGPVLGRVSVYAAEEEVPQTEPETEVVEPEVQEPETELEVNNEAQVSNEVESTANSGDNTIEEPEAEPETTENLEDQEATPAAVTTGDSVSVVEVENEVNSTEINSEVIYQTLNLFSSGDIDLTNPETLEQIVSQALTDNQEAAEINVVVTSINNLAYVSNEVVAMANTGNNNIEGATQATIDTGDAYSVVSLLNKVNTTIINSTIHMVTINIFGVVEGDIVLPELNSGTNDSCDGCDNDLEINNQAVVENQVASQAVSGENTIVGTENTSIETGDANSVVNVVNVVNQTLVGVTFYNLVINTLGSWVGGFLGWDDFLAAEAGDLSLNSTTGQAGGEDDCSGCTGDLSIDNQAQVYNSITSTANTGGNSIEGETAEITTGQAYSVVSLINFVNTSIINSSGFFGFINIFGLLSGDIGGESMFVEKVAVVEDEEEVAAESEPAPRETGGLLEVNQSNNVGEYVLPGDTVTFTVEVTNPGAGRVFDTSLYLTLVKDGVNMGGVQINLGTIEARKGKRISTGLVLSTAADPGEYVAQVEVTGQVGPENETVSAIANSSFAIAGFSVLTANTDLTEPVLAADSQGETLSEMTGAVAGLTREKQLIKLFWVLLIVYLLAKGFEERKKLAVVWAKNRQFIGAKTAYLRSLILSLIAFLR